MDSKEIDFDVDSIMPSFPTHTVTRPHRFVWALEMRMMMGFRVPEGTIGRLSSKTAEQQTLPGVFEDAAKAWKEQLQNKLQRG